MRAIYTPAGLPEYAQLVLNPYAGCSHGCKYCYNNREDRRQGLYDKPAKKATLDNIRRDLESMHATSDTRAVLISDVGDLYDTGRKGGNKPMGLMKYLSEGRCRSSSKSKRCLRTQNSYYLSGL